MGDYVDRGHNSVETFQLLLVLKCRYIPVTTIIVTTGGALPDTPIKPGSPYKVTFEILAKLMLATPFGPMSAFIQRRNLSRAELNELEMNSDDSSVVTRSTVGKG